MNETSTLIYDFIYIKDVAFFNEATVVWINIHTHVCYRVAIVTVHLVKKESEEIG